MDSQIRNVELNDINDLIRINELSIPAVNSITEAKFEWFYNNSLYFRLIKSTGDEIYGFLLVLNSALDYESINYKWFQNRYDQFAYIDRVAILKKYKRIDGLVNNAYPRSDDWGNKFEDIELDSWKQNLEWQLNSYFYLSQQVANLMEGQNKGRGTPKSPKYINVLHFIQVQRVFTILTHKSLSHVLYN